MSSYADAERRERRTKRRYDEASTSIQHRDPWPRDDKTPIDTFEEFADPKKVVNSKECINRVLKDEWDDYDSLFYNAWLGVSIEPIRGIRYMISIPELCRIYSFDEAAAASKIPPFLGLNGFWEIIGTGAWDSNSAT
ncbi:hypothetical protein F2Q69_00054791 [Brassica cretica]|uniref:Uncharacterized protein n=1 Tax=Brassica cretica TaxID=69181 RepID=A0A8S9MVI4_BRACR|nr:hypothetical protein F2Q69_00054791 [Brassica cretica]